MSITVWHFSPTVCTAHRWLRRNCAYFTTILASEASFLQVRRLSRKCSVFSRKRTVIRESAPQFLKLCCLVKHRNARIAALFVAQKPDPVKIRRVLQVAARLAKSAAIPYFGASRTNPEVPRKSAGICLRAFLKFQYIKLHYGLVIVNLFRSALGLELLFSKPFFDVLYMPDLHQWHACALQYMCICI